MDELTIEELSASTGISVRNLRFYTTRGLVPPPMRRGRSAVYGPDHTARFRLLRELQAHGLTLAAIEKYFANIPADATAEQIALHSATLQPFVVEEPLLLTRRGLNELAGRAITESDLQRLIALSAVTEQDGGRLAVLETRFRSAMRLIDLDVPTALVEACDEVYRRHSYAMASELSTLFRELLWPAYKSHELDAEQMVSILDDFQQASVNSLVHVFGEAITEARRAEIERRALSPTALTPAVTPV